MAAGYARALGSAAGAAVRQRVTLPAHLRPDPLAHARAIAHVLAGLDAGLLAGLERERGWSRGVAA